MSDTVNETPGGEPRNGGDPGSVEFWSDPKRVDEFANREADHRLAELARSWADPRGVRVLDLGCAGGRNARFLADLGFDVWALDAADAMVMRCRKEVSGAMGKSRARRQILVGEMQELPFLRDEDDTQKFGLVVALGIYHMARDEADLDRSLAETVRVLSPEGVVLVSVFAPGTVLKGREMQPVEGSEIVYRGSDDETNCLLAPGPMDEWMARHGMRPDEPTEKVERIRDDSHRVVTNGLYVRS